MSHLHSRPNLQSIMPSWDIVTAVAELYLLHCDCQPLPLFHRRTFIGTLATRDSEVLFAMLALAIRFLDDARVCERPLDLIAGYAEVSRNVVMRKVVEGSVELSTLQSLCLLTLVDFSSTQQPQFIPLEYLTRTQTEIHAGQVFIVV